MQDERVKDEGKKSNDVGRYSRQFSSVTGGKMKNRLETRRHSQIGNYAENEQIECNVRNGVAHSTHRMTSAFPFIYRVCDHNERQKNGY